MDNTLDQQRGAVDTLALEQAYQDGLIAERLPDWIGKLKVVKPTDQDIPASGLYESQHTALHEAFKTSLCCRQRLSADLTPIQGIDLFARPLLQRAMREAFGTSALIDQLFFRVYYFAVSPKPAGAAGRQPQMVKSYYDIPLLEAALYNFSEAETVSSGQPRDNAVVDLKGEKLRRPTAVEFAGLCRTLDLGTRYQQHLDSILKAPAKDTASGHGVSATLKDRYRSEMLIAACKAKAEGVLNAGELALVIELYQKGTSGTLGEAPVIARQMQAFGCDLQQIVVLDVIHEGWLFNFSRRVLVYIPGDPHGPWSVGVDLEAFTRRILGRRLRKKPYQQFFSRFVRRRDSHRFFAKVAAKLEGVADFATREMDQHMAAYALPLFDELAQAHIKQIKDDAEVIAVPARKIDRQLQREYRQQLEAEGWTFLSLAAFFVPALGALLLAVMVWDLLDELFHAVEDWRDGDTSAALDHVLSIAKTVAVIGATAAVAGGVSRAWNALDKLVPARLEKGGDKLWNGDVTPFRGAAPPAFASLDEQGVYRLGERSWVSMEGHYFEVRQRASDEQWQLLPRQGHGPVLRSNGAGAWRVWSEQPAEWEDPYCMFRRLEGPFRQLDDAQIDQAMSIHGLNTDHLRALHVYGKAPEPELADTVSRLLIERRIRDLVSALRTAQGTDYHGLLGKVKALPGAAGKTGQALADEVWAQRRAVLRQLYDETQVTDDASVLAIRKVFPRLHRFAAKQLLGTATQADRDYLARTHRLPFQLVQAARVSMLRIRIARACEALFFDTPQDLDLARVALAMLEEIGGWGKRPHWRLFDGDALRPLLTTGGDGRSFRLVHRDGQFMLEDALGVGLTGPGELFGVLVEALEPEDIDALGLVEPYAPSLRAMLARQASAQRRLIARLLGMGERGTGLITPHRLDDGRIGYPLGGNSMSSLPRSTTRPRSLVARLRDLYPVFSDAQVQDWLLRMHLAGRPVSEELAVLEQQAQLLGDSLKQWEQGGLLAGDRQARGRFRSAMLACWREVVPVHIDPAGQQLDITWTFTGEPLRSLPPLPAQVSFPHVQSLALRALKLKALPDEFLRAFPCLRALEVTGSKLQRLPFALALKTTLRVLDLSDNRITLDSAQAATLSTCRSLVYLNLSGNPLGGSLSVLTMTQLSELHVRRAQLEAVPFGVLQIPQLYLLDLTDNAIGRLPEGFLQSELWREGCVDLTGNPIAERQSISWQEEWETPYDSQVPHHLRWLDRMDGELRDSMATAWSGVDIMDGSANFIQLLAALTRSADFKGIGTFNYLSARVLDLMESMMDDAELARELLDNAVVENCADNATAVLSDLEVRKLLWQTVHHTPKAERGASLVRLARRLWRLEQVKYHAWQDASRTEQGRRESLEVALAYCLGLRDALDLPIGVRTMRFAGVVQVLPEDVARTRQLVLSAETADTLAVWMLEREFWQTYVADTCKSRLQLPASYHVRLDVLQAESASAAQFAALQEEAEQWAYQRKFDLTVEALNQWP
ncbi:NEL-type E3 ubiquitin ligase domain-containing protein [Pseudomonas sp. CAM1A]|uniref:NEL-type E3 ubiquitin ligase domain-containing protein n=1 Tax=Pseudomonas sp. CAM1A TaxID=3231717 RepID=UPI0039C5E26A